MDLDAADWITAAIGPFDHTIRSLVPQVFEAYARVLHPARRHDGAGGYAEVRWAEVAAANDRVAHAGMQWVAITGSWRYVHQDSQPGVWDVAPEEGSLPADTAAALVQVLTRFTATPDACLYAVWSGFGALAVPRSAPTLQMPQREMRLLAGPLVEAGEVSMETPPWEQSPSLWWPDDRAWCVATDVDLMSTYVGASSTCVDAITSHPGLEAYRVDDDHGLAYDSDRVNPVVPHPG